LADQNELVRRRAAEVLGQLCDSRSVGPLIDVLSDKNELVRQQAAEALGLIGDKRAIEALEMTLKIEKNPQTLAAVTNALKLIRSIDAKEKKLSGKNINSIIGMLIEQKIYIGAGAGVFILLIIFLITIFRRRKSTSAQTADFHSPY